MVILPLRTRTDSRLIPSATGQSVRFWPTCSLPAVRSISHAPETDLGSWDLQASLMQSASSPRSASGDAADFKSDGGSGNSA